MIISTLQNKSLISPPKWLPSNTAYLTYMGSTAYGVAHNDSDADVYGFVIPPKDMIFPHLKGEIPGFGKQTQRFEVWQEHHIRDGKKEWDFSIYGIVKYLQLVMENNPNMVETLFTSRNHVIHSSTVAEMVRDARKSMLHKGAWHKFRGYAYSNLSKIRGKTVNAFFAFCQENGIPDTVAKSDVLAYQAKKDTPYREDLSRLSGPKVDELLSLLKNMPEVKSSRLNLVRKFGFDTKYAYHTVRLMLEAEQILSTGDLILDRDAALYKAIREGEWSLERVEEFFNEKERYLEDLYGKSTLPYTADEDAIRTLLLSCLEEHYGSLGNALVIPDAGQKLLKEMEDLVNRYRGLV